MVDVARVALGALNGGPAVAIAGEWIAEIVNGSDVAVALGAASGDIAIALDANGTIASGEQEVARTLTRQ